jgi:hypothetical protein
MAAAKGPKERRLKFRTLAERANEKARMIPTPATIALPPLAGNILPRVTWAIPTKITR